MQPAEHDVARRLHQALTFDHAAAVVLELALAGEAFEHRGLRLLELQEQRVLLGGAAPPAAGSSSACRPSRRRRSCGRCRRSGSPRAAGGGRPGAWLCTRRTGPAWRPAGRRASPAGSRSTARTITGGSLMICRCPSTRVVSLAKAFMLSFVVAFAVAFSTRDWNSLRCPAFSPDIACVRSVAAEHRVPDLEVAHVGESADRLAIAAHAAEQQIAAHGPLEALRAPRDRDARHRGA